MTSCHCFNGLIVGGIKISRWSFNKSPNRKTQKKHLKTQDWLPGSTSSFHPSPTRFHALLLRSWRRQTKELLSQTRSWRITCAQEKDYLFVHTYPVGNWIRFWTSISSWVWCWKHVAFPNRLPARQPSAHSPAHPWMRKAACCEVPSHESDQKLQTSQL